MDEVGDGKKPIAERVPKGGSRFGCSFDGIITRPAGGEDGQPRLVGDVITTF